MFKKALVAVDFSPSTEALISCLPDLKRWGVEALVLAHVIKIGYGQGSGIGHEAAYLDKLVRYGEPSKAADLIVETRVSASSAVAQELIATATNTQCDLIVIGSRSHNFLYDIFLGSVAREVTRLAHIPVLVERLEPVVSGKAETCAAVCRNALDTVLLATDHSAQSRGAEAAALRLAGHSGRIDSVTVIDAHASEGEVAATRTSLEKLAADLRAAGTQAGTILEHGDAAASIIRTSARGYSLIIIGKHGLNWVASKIIGSTTAAICEGARLPVLVVPLPNT